jgi:hypothetical protein
LNAPNTSPAPVQRTAQLTLRDLQLLAEVAERPPLPLELLAARHFAGIRKTALNRLRRLVLAGYLTSEQIQLLERPAPVLFYSATPKAKQALERRPLLGERFGDA